MKRKYYLRGLGLGILITSLVFIIASPTGLSDEEIIKRAEELGYVNTDETTDSLGIKELLTATPDPEDIHTVAIPDSFKAPSPTATPTPEPTDDVEEDPEEFEDETGEEEGETEDVVPEPTSTPTPVPTEPPTPTEKPEPSVITATIVVEQGNTASIVCNKIEAAGIIKSADKLKDYLVEHDLADYINIGTYRLSDDMSIQEIADIITGR